MVYISPVLISRKDMPHNLKTSKSYTIKMKKNIFKFALKILAFLEIECFINIRFQTKLFFFPDM